MRSKLLVAAAIVLGAACFSVDGSAEETQNAYEASVRVTTDKVGALRSLATTLQQAADQAPPAKLTTEQIAELKRYDAWIRTASERVVSFTASWEQRVDATRAACEKTPTCNKVALTKQLQEINMSFNLQYLQLQSQMQNENRSYTAISNIMKTKHDTVKNSIDNVR